MLRSKAAVPLFNPSESGTQFDSLTGSSRSRTSVSLRASIVGYNSQILYADSKGLFLPTIDRPLRLQ